jgi:imidazole glycerol-phosphate synthase subunit HisF
VKRIICRLDIKSERLVKGIQLEGIRPLGDPAEFAGAYYREGADELLFVDVVASLYGRNTLLDIIRSTATEVFCPLAVGGGIRTLEDVRTVLRAGADKVCINTAALDDPGFVTAAAERFGASTVVVNIEAKQRETGGWEALTNSGRERTGQDAVDWAVEAAERGAGELLVTSIDREGTGSGLDLHLIRAITARIGVPVIACGGIGTAADIAAGFEAGASAVAAASLFHYQRLAPQPARLGSGIFAPEPPRAVQPTSLAEVRDTLGIPRHSEWKESEWLK